MTERYESLGGNGFDRWAIPLTVPCPTCGVEVGVKCVNKVAAGKTAHIACVARLSTSASAAREAS